MNLSGTGTAPAIAVSQGATAYTSNGTAYAFPATVQGSQSASVVFTIKNTGTATLTLGTATLTGAFQLTAPASTSIAAGASTTFSVLFAPTAAGAFTGTVTLPNNAVGSPFVLNLSGTSTAPAIAVSQGATAYTSSGTAYAFPATLQGGQSTSVVFTINNTGTSTLTLGIAAITGPFQLTAPASTSIAAGSSTTFSVVFAPTTTGTFSGTVTLPNNAAGSPFVLNLSGTGTLATGTTGTLDASAITISPNPSNGNALLKMNGIFSNVSINVYNALGERVAADKLGNANDTSFPIVLTDAASGMYIVEIITDQGSSMKRLIKE